MILVLVHNSIIETRDVAQPGRAFALGAKGPRFESLYPDHDL